MSDVTRIYDLYTGSFLPGSPVVSALAPPNKTFLQDPLKTDFWFFGKSIFNETRALFSRFDMGNLIKPPSGVRIDEAKILMRALITNSDSFSIDVGVLKRDGRWDQEIHSGSIESPGVNAANFFIRNAAFDILAETSAEFLPELLPLSTLLVGGARAAGQSILNSSAIDSVKFVTFRLKKTGTPTGSLFVDVYPVENGTSGMIDLSVSGNTPIATTDAVDIAPLSTSNSQVVFTFLSSITHPIGTYLAYVIRTTQAFDPSKTVSIVVNGTLATSIGGFPINNSDGFGIGFEQGTYGTFFELAHLRDILGVFLPGLDKVLDIYNTKWKHSHSPVVSETVPTFTIGEVAEIDVTDKVQKWIDDPRYPYEMGLSEAIGFVFSPISASRGATRIVDRDHEFPMQLEISWTNPTIGCVDFDGVIDDAVSLEAVIDESVSFDGLLDDSISMDAVLDDSLSFIPALAESISFQAELC